MGSGRPLGAFEPLERPRRDSARHGIYSTGLSPRFVSGEDSRYLKDSSKEVIIWKARFIETVRKCFETRKLHKPGSSLRNFAASIRTPASTVSEIVNGKVLLAPKRAAEIVVKLEIPDRERDHLLALLNQPIHVDRDQFTDRDYVLLTDWRHLAILHFFELDGAEKTADAISKRLGLEVDIVKNFMEDLQERGLLRETEAGDLEATGKNWQTSDGPPSDVIRKYHGQCLKAADHALQRIAVHERDFTSLLFAGNSRQIDEIRQEIRILHKKIAAIGEGLGPRDRLYSLNVQFFPLDQAEVSQ